MVAGTLVRPLYELLLALGVLGAGLVISQIAKVDPTLATKLTELLRVGPEADIDLTQMEFWKVQEAERFVRENPMQPTEGMSFGKPWVQHSPWEFAYDSAEAEALVEDILYECDQDPGDGCEPLLKKIEKYEALARACEEGDGVRLTPAGTAAFYRYVVARLRDMLPAYCQGDGDVGLLKSGLPGDPAKKVFGGRCGCC